MRKYLLSVLAVTAALAGGAAARANFVEQFETLTLDALGAPPGEVVSLPSGNWYAYNNSNVVGFRGVARQSGVFSPSPGDGTYYAQVGDEVMAGNFGPGAPFNADFYFQTPVVTLSNGDTLSFVARSATFGGGDRLHVKLSTSGESTVPGAFATTLLTINPDVVSPGQPGGFPTEWTEYTLTVSGLGGPVSGRFAFNYDTPDVFYTGTNGGAIAIDRVTYTAAVVPEPAGLGLLGVVGAGLMRRRR